MWVIGVLVGVGCFKCCAGFYRKPYMKRLDKPTNSLGGNLLNIKKTSANPAKNKANPQVSDCLASETLFHCLTVLYGKGALKS
jgi:hypothetical protein